MDSLTLQLDQVTPKLAKRFWGIFKPIWQAEKRDPTTLPRYPYAKLEPDQIRLITLLRGEENDEIHVEIETVYVKGERLQGYAALSYVWGDTEKNLKPVFVNENNVHWATHSLWHALRRIRAGDEDRVLWVDAICINQDDDEERSVQVGQMSWIYPQATTVLCWLGDDDGTVAEAFSELGRWATAYDVEAQRPSYETHVSRVHAAQRPGHKTALGLLFSRPYFTRAWCLPEVCVHPRKALVLCGTNEISWRRLYFGFISMASGLNEHELMHVVGPSLHRVTPMLKICWNPPEKMLLSYLIPLMSDRKCSDPKDKIFSLLGLVERARMKAPIYPKANYEWSLEETCLLYTRAAIQIERRLDILRAICPFREKDNMPSWCLKPDQWLQYPDAGGIEMISGGLFKKYKACGNREIHVLAAQSDMDKKLFVQGSRFDHIAYMHDISYFLVDLFTSTTRWSDILQKTRKLCNDLDFPRKYVATGQPIAEALLNALCVDDFWIQSPEKQAPVRRELLYKAYREYVTNSCNEKDLTLGEVNTILDERQLFDYMSTQFTFADKPADSSHVDEVPENVVPYYFLERQAIVELSILVRQRTGNRNLIVTSKGYIGFGLNTCVVSDEVCLIPGSDVPLILRESAPSNGKELSHVFVGDAYVHGIMYGEAMDQRAKASCAQNEEQNIDLQLFCIR